MISGVLVCVFEIKKLPDNLKNSEMEQFFTVSSLCLLYSESCELSMIIQNLMCFEWRLKFKYKKSLSIVFNRQSLASH